MTSRFGRKLARLQEAQTRSKRHVESVSYALNSNTSALTQAEAQTVNGAQSDAQRAERLQRLRKAQLLARAPGPLRHVPHITELRSEPPPIAPERAAAVTPATSRAPGFLPTPAIQAPETRSLRCAVGSQRAALPTDRTCNAEQGFVATTPASGRHSGHVGLASRLEALTGIGLQTALTDGHGRGPGAQLRAAFTCDTPHGHTALGAWPAFDAATEAATFAALGMEGARLEDLLFFDTETTGLAGGTGTVPFLIGFGYLEGSQFVIEQHFLPDLGLEEPLLRSFSDALARRRHLVSFNGKSFDWPLVRTRAQLAQQPLNPPASHCALLHIARRMFRADTEHFRLGALERTLLGFERRDDLPSAQVPERYFEYLRTNDAQPLAPVLRHNLWDILSLLRLLSETVAVFCPRNTEYTAEYTAQHTPALDAPPPLRSVSPTARAECAFIAWRRGQTALAKTCFDAAESALGAHPPATLSPALWRFGAALLRRGNPPGIGEASALEREERRLLRGLASAQVRMDADGETLTPNPLFRRDLARSHLALAKFYEHRAKDVYRAYAHAAQSAASECEALHQRRLERLSRCNDTDRL